MNWIQALQLLYIGDITIWYGPLELWYKYDPMTGRVEQTECCNTSTGVQRLSTQCWVTMINVSDASVTNRKRHNTHSYEKQTTWFHDVFLTMWQAMLWFSIRFMSRQGTLTDIITSESDNTWMSRWWVLNLFVVS